MGLFTGRNQLLNATKALLAQWERTSEEWQDERARVFEATYIAPIEAAMKGALSAAEELRQVTAAVRRDCE